MKILVGVTEEDRQCGQPRSCEFCPVARAIVRALNKPDLHVKVGRGSVRIQSPYVKDSPMVSAILRLPEDVTRFIFLHDEGLNFPLPAPFELELPDTL